MSQKQPVYRKKGESTAQEETKGEKPQHRVEEGSSHRGGRGGRGERGGHRENGNERGGHAERGNRGGFSDRGGRGGYQGRGGARATTSYAEKKPYYQKKTENQQDGEETKEDGQKQGDKRAQGRNQDVDENTYYYRYFYAPRPKHERVQVTAETEVPAIIPKDQRKQQPSQQAFEKAMKDLDTQIENLRNKIRNIGLKKRETADGGKVSGKNVTYRDYLNEKFAAIKAIREERKAYVDEIRIIKDELAQIEPERNNLQKGFSRTLNKPEDIKVAIAELERRYEHTTLKSNAEEKKILMDIKSMKASIPNAERLQAILPRIEKLHIQKKEISAKLDAYTKDMESIEAEIELIKKEQDEAKEKREDLKQVLDKYEDDIQKVKDDLQALYDKKNLVREEYFKAKLEFELEKDEIYQAEWIAKEKQKIADRDEQKKRRIEERKQALLDRPNPYEREIETCEHLIAYCNRLKVISGLVQAPVDEQIKQEQKAIVSDLNKEEVKKKLQEGKLEASKTKKEREEEEMVRVGGKKKGKTQKKPKAKDFEVEEAFKIDITVINKFGFLKVSPPLDKDSLDSKIKELTEKRVKYHEDGEARLRDEEEKLGEGTLIEDEEYQPREDREEGSYRGRGGRGGRGSRGGRGGFRGGDRNDRPQTEGGRGRGGRREREEYQDDDDDGYIYSEPIHTKQGKRNNKKEDLAVNENNYPDLA